MMRVLRSLGATIVLLGLLGAVPWLLWHTIGNPLQAWPDLVAGDISDKVVYSLLATVTWLAWAQFLIAFVVELTSGLRRSPLPRRITGVFSFQQVSARALITAALMLGPAMATTIAPTALAVAAVAPATPAVRVATPATSSVQEHVSSAAAPVQEIPAAPAAVLRTVTITRGGPHTWWDLAALHLGSGSRWSELWQLNAGRPEPGGVRLTGPAMLRDGWTVLVPESNTSPASAPADRGAAAASVHGPAAYLESTAAATVVTVAPGDNLVGLATAHDTTWVALWEANRDRPQPDGRVLSDPDVLLPGWTVLIPGSATPRPAPNEVTVVPGDTLSGVAATHHQPLADLWAANQGRPEPGGAAFTDPDSIEPGWSITVPAPASTPAGASPPATSRQAAAVHAADQQRAAQAAHAAAEQRAAAEADAKDAQARAAAQQGAERAAALTVAAARAAAAAKEADQAPPTSTTPWAALPSPPGGTPTRPTMPVARPAAAAPTESNGAARGQSASSLPALAIGGGGALLTGLTFAALMAARRRQFRWRRPGRGVRATPPALASMERTLLTQGSQHLPDVTWLDTALRSLAQELRQDSSVGIPEVVAARLSVDDLQLVLARPAQSAPAPWHMEDYGLRWVLDRAADLPAVDAEHSFGPLPALVSVGYTPAGEHWLIDLEMVGSVALAGDRERCLSLARFMAAELAHNSWSDALQVTMVGFGDDMAAANPARLLCTAELGPVLRSLEIQLAAVAQVSADAEVDVERGRLYNVAGDTWAAQVVLVGPDAVGDRAELAAVLERLGSTDGRQAAAVVLTVDDADGDGSAARWQLHVDAAGVLSVPALGLQLVAEQLPAAEAADLAQLLALAAATDDVPVSPAAGDRPWEKFADAAGALRPELTTATEPSPVRLAGTSPEREGSVLPLPTHVYVTSAAVTRDDVEALAPGVSAEVREEVERSSGSLDADLADWWDEASATPKVTVLGSLDVRAQGRLDPQRPRRAWNVELVTYLAMMPGGVTAEQMGVDLWPDEVDVHTKSKLRNAVTTARRWLGPNPRTGRDHLPTNSGVAGARYRLEDVLVDSELFRRLRVRAVARGADGLPDLQAALQLVTGVPFSDKRPRGYGWLSGGLDHAFVGMIADVSHIVATQLLAIGEPDAAMAAAQVALRGGSYGDEALMDCAAACFARGLTAEGSSYVKRIVANHSEDGVEEDLPKHTYEVLLRRGWLAS